MEHLEEFKSQIMEHTPVCHPLEAVGEKEKPGISQPQLEEGKPKLEDVKPLYFQPSNFKRELKIIGQIGEPRQKDKLSFVSLARQIEDALQKGYKPLEVVDTVVRSINPGMGLRSYLEGLEGQGWPSGESTCLAPMWPGFDFRTRCHMWIEFVGSLLCYERFSPGYSGFPLSKTSI